MHSHSEFKFKLPIAGGHVLLTHDQLATVFSTIDGMDLMVESWVGDGRGDKGSNYRTLVRQVDIQTMDLRTVRQDTIDAYKLVTKLYDEQNTK